MSRWSWIVFINLFLIPIIFHPFIICRHMIHIGHEPYHPKPLSSSSYETSISNLVERSRSVIYRYSSIQHETIFQRIWNFLLRLPKPHSPKIYYYPNLISYTLMYLRDHDLSPFLQSFVLMYVSYFILIYISSLVHVYRISWRRKRISSEQVRHRITHLMEASYLRWIFNAVSWKCFAVILSHPFHVLAVKIMMQCLFLSYGHFTLAPKSLYSWWNLPKNLQLIYDHENWTICFSGLLPRMIYELGITAVPRLIWWPIRSILFSSTSKSYFRASSAELYFLQCIVENLLRCFSVYLQVFARLATLDIVNQMHEQINRKKYPLLFLLYYRFDRPWFLPISISLIDTQLITRGLSVFFRLAY